LGVRIERRSIDMSDGESTETITKVTITDTVTKVEGGRPYTVYVTEIESQVSVNGVLAETSMWTESRRYSEFADLDKLVRICSRANEIEIEILINQSSIDQSINQLIDIDRSRIDERSC